MTAGQGEDQGGEGLCWQREARASRDMVTGDIPSTVQELWLETSGATTLGTGDTGEPAGAGRPQGLVPSCRPPQKGQLGFQCAFSVL